MENASESTRNGEISEKNDGEDEGIGCWLKGKAIGRGGHGIVYMGQIKSTGAKIAVKQMQIDGMSNAELKNLQNEINLMKMLEHPNIVRYLGAETAGIMLNIFLELVEGGSLRRYVRRHGALEELKASHITRHILEGLQYLHSKGIAHRDVKGANVLLCRSCVAKLADFGSSKCLGQESMISGLKGTPHWMAPEVIKGQQCNEQGWLRADVWSVGCTVIEMVTGEKPWPQYNNPMAAMYHIASGAPLPYPETLSPRCLSFVKACCCFEAQERPSVKELLCHEFILQSSSLSPEELLLWGENNLFLPDFDATILDISAGNDTALDVGLSSGVRTPRSAETSSIVPRSPESPMKTSPSPDPIQLDVNATLDVNKRGVVYGDIESAVSRAAEKPSSRSTGSSSSPASRRRSKKNGHKHRSKKNVRSSSRRKESCFECNNADEGMDEASITVSNLLTSATRRVSLSENVPNGREKRSKGVRRQRTESAKKTFSSSKTNLHEANTGSHHTEDNLECDLRSYGHERHKEPTPAVPLARNPSYRSEFEFELVNTSDLMYSPGNQDLYKDGSRDRNGARSGFSMALGSSSGDRESPRFSRQRQPYSNSPLNDQPLSSSPTDHSHSVSPPLPPKSNCSLPRIGNSGSSFRHCNSRPRNFEDELSSVSSLSPVPFEKASNYRKATPVAGSGPVSSSSSHQRPRGPLTGEYLDPTTSFTPTNAGQSKGGDAFFSNRCNIRQQAELDVQKNFLSAASNSRCGKAAVKRAQTADMVTGNDLGGRKLAPLDTGPRTAPAKAEEFANKLPGLSERSQFSGPIKDSTISQMDSTKKSMVPIQEDSYSGAGCSK